jgi:hypothetical protein
MGTRHAPRRNFATRPSLAQLEREEGPLPPSPLDALLTTTQRRLLAFLFGEPERAFHLRELLALTGSGHGAAQRELRRLERAGLVRVSHQRGRSFLQADTRSPIHGALVELVRMTVGLTDPLRHAFADVEADLHLCFALEPERDPLAAPARDLGMIVVPAPGLSTPAEGLLRGREVAERWLSRSIWMVEADADRLRQDEFLKQLLLRPRVWVFGDEARLAEALSAVR